MGDVNGVVSWVATWIIMIALLGFLAQTNWGRPVVYWLLWLAVVLLLVTHADELTALFNVNALQLNG